MGKVKESVVDYETDDQAPEYVKPNLTHNAASICYLPGKGWAFVTLKYNPLTLEAGEVEFKNVGEGLEYIKERFKIDVVNPKELNGLDIFNNSGNKW